MQIFQRLGKDINSRWEKLNYDINCFPSVAEESLVSMNFGKTSVEEIYDWVINSKTLVGQVNIDSGFGEPPLTVFASEKFYIEILFWLTGTTSIHQHGFRGAFYVFSGSSIHTEYQFDESVRVNEHLLFGNLITKKIECLEKGQHRRIEGGSDFIHALFHLDYPSVSMVIRTYKDPNNSIQFRYMKPHIAINSFHKDQRMTRQGQILKMLKRCGHPKFKALLFDFVNQADLHTLVGVTTTLANENLISVDEEEEIVRLYEIRYPQTIKFIKPVFPEIRRVGTIRQGRSYVTDPAHRFFMALLMNATDRHQVIQVITAKYPNEKAETLILKWIQELNDKNKFNSNFDNFQLELIELMLKPLSFEEIILVLKESYDSNEIEDTKEKIFDIHCSIIKLPLLKVLFKSPRV